jgi:hypothetical protein
VDTWSFGPSRSMKASSVSVSQSIGCGNRMDNQREQVWRSVCFSLPLGGTHAPPAKTGARLSETFDLSVGNTSNRSYIFVRLFLLFDDRPSPRSSARFRSFPFGVMDAAMDKFECNRGLWARSRWQLDCIRERHCSGEALERDGRPQTLIKRRAAWTATMCFSAE